MALAIRANLGRLLLLAALVWLVLATALFRVRPAVVSGEEDLADYRQKVCVAYAPGAYSADERFFPTGHPEDYRRLGKAAWTRLRHPPPPPGVALEPPIQAAIRRVAEVLPDPGPNLQGAADLPQRRTGRNP